MKKLRLIPSMLVFVLLVSANSFAESSKDYLQNLSKAFQDVAERVTPAVVHIESTVKADESEQQVPPSLFDLFHGAPRPRERRGLGSGVIIDAKKGYILTNGHVVSGEDGKSADKIVVTVTTGTNGDNKVHKEYPAKVIGADFIRVDEMGAPVDGTDLAIIQIEAEDLTEAPLGDSNDVKVGEWVMAIGNPFGLDQSVTAGIVSYFGRSNTRITGYDRFIQTDAAINPGNSGGPLVNLNGEVVGINTAIVTGGIQASYAGVGFAIPINMARDIVDELIEKGRVERGWLGISMRDLTEELAIGLDIDSERGVLVDTVFEGSPADDAGIKSGDVVLEIDGEPIVDANDLRFKVAACRPGEELKMTLLREGEHKKLSVTLGNRSEGLSDAGTMLATSPISERMGLQVSGLTPELQQGLGIEADAKGVVVTQVVPGSPSDRAGLQRGDLILEVGREEVGNPSEFWAAAQKSAQEKGIVVVLRVRGKLSAYAAINLKEE